VTARKRHAVAHTLGGTDERDDLHGLELGFVRGHDPVPGEPGGDGLHDALFTLCGLPTRGSVGAHGEMLNAPTFLAEAGWVETFGDQSLVPPGKVHPSTVPAEPHGAGAPMLLGAVDGGGHEPAKARVEQALPAGHAVAYTVPV
jgi:hypothetical protein